MNLCDEHNICINAPDLIGRHIRIYHTVAVKPGRVFRKVGQVGIQP